MENQNLPEIIKTAIQKQGINIDNVNLILPTQTFGQALGEYDVLSFEVVKIEPTDCYQITKGKNVFAKRPLMQISNALGILWDPKTTTILESSERKSRAKATGALKKPNGEWIVLTAEKTTDLDAIEEEQRLKQEEYAESGKLIRWDNNRPIKEPWSKHGGAVAKQASIDLEVRKAVLPYWKFKDERAETGAKERVIRQIVALKENYTDAEINKPFALPKIMVDVSKMLSDPRVQQIALERMTDSVTSIFGKQPEVQIPGKGDVLSDHYTIEENNDNAQPEAQDNSEKDPWDAVPVKTDEESNNLSMLEDVRKRRHEYDLELSPKAKAEIDVILNLDSIDYKKISNMVERLNAWEDERKKRGDSK